MASPTFAELIQEIQGLCREENGRSVINDADLILAQMGNSMAYVSMQTDSTPSMVSTFLSLTTGTGYGPYTVSATYTDVIALASFRETLNGREVKRIDLPVLHSLRTGTTIDTGSPKVIAFDEQSDGTLKAYVHPIPDQSYTLEATVALPMSADGDTFMSGGQDMATTMSLPGNIRRALTHHTAGMLMATIKESYSALLLKAAEDFISGENKRIKSFRRPSTVVYRNSY